MLVDSGDGRAGQSQAGGGSASTARARTDALDERSDILSVGGRAVSCLTVGGRRQQRPTRVAALQYGRGACGARRDVVDLSTQIEARGATYRLAGTYAPEYRAVVDAFVENFRVEDEVGAACSIVLDGRTVVDVWGGWRDRAMQVPWDAPTTVCMMSVAKGITAICFNMLIDRGLVDPNARVTQYWPEYGRNGKEKTLVRHFLDHTAAVPVLTTNPLWPGAMFDREAIVKALEEQEPLWEIGTKAAYHVHHQGFLLGEIMRRVTGKTVGPFLREEVATPLDAEYYIGGMTDAEQALVAEVMPNMEAKLFAAKDGADQTSLRALAFKQNPTEPWAVDA